MKQTLPTSVVPADMQRIREQMQDYITDAAALPISFICGGERIKGLPARFSPRVKEERKGDVIERTFTGKDETGLEITVVTTEYTDFPVAEIVAYFRGGAQNTPVLRDILAFDGKFRGRRPVLYHNTGDYYSSNGYETRSELMEPNFQTHMNFAPTGGRACDEAFPYFKLQCEGFGLNIAVGWPAQWKANFRSIQGGVAMQAGQEITHLYIRPGETIRTPRITIMAYEGDYARGINLWRRWYFKHILPRPNGKPIPKIMHASYNGGGPEFTESTEQNQLEYIQKYVDSGLPYNCWWIDAGWYDCTLPDGTKFWPLTGNWYADKKRYPIGLRPISNKLHQHGMSFLLWFEPERVRPGTWLYNEHPEWILRAEEEYDDGDFGTSKNCLLNLGDPDCCDFMIGYISTLLQLSGVDIYRQDFNFPPLRVLRAQDEFDRQGAAENLYVQGYLRYWDGLLQHCPGLWIDSCSSGGRRNDLETLRRSVPLHYTDYGYGNHPVKQAFQITMHSWMPYFRSFAVNWDSADGTYARHPDDNVRRPADNFARHNAIAAFFGPSFGLDVTDEDRVMYEVWSRAADLLLESDFYALTEYSKSPESFYSIQFDCPEKGKGYIQGIRNTRCPHETFTVYPHGFEAGCSYAFENMETGESFTKTGEELIEQGFAMTMPQRTGYIWFYEKISAGKARDGAGPFSGPRPFLSAKGSALGKECAL